MLLPIPKTSGRFAAEALDGWIRRLAPLSRRATLWSWALTRLVIRKAADEWRGSYLHLKWLDRLADPRRRPPAPGVALGRETNGSLEQGRRLLAGVFAFDGAEMVLGPEGDPWDRPSPSRRFARALHSFDWLDDLMTMGEAGAVRALTLTLEWERLFGRWSDFSWTCDITERRLARLARHLRPLLAKASDLEAARITTSLARQAHDLLSVRRDPHRAAERAAAAGLIGCALGGMAGDVLLDQALPRLGRRLQKAVPAQGGHASRSPQQAVELHQRMEALDGGLKLRGRAMPPTLAQVLPRLETASRFFTLADGALAAFHGGVDRPSPLAPYSVQAATVQTQGGYHRLVGQRLEVMVDAAPPPTGPFSVAACGQPLAIEVTAGGSRLITSSAWNPQVGAPAALRLSEAGSCASLGEAAAGSPLSGLLARGLGPRLVRGASEVSCQRQSSQDAMWLELTQDAWVERFGLVHERRLYLDHAGIELRGEDVLRPLAPDEDAESGRRALPFAVRFQLHPSVRESLVRDEHSVLLRAPGETGGWRLRSDVPQIAIEDGVHYRDGQPRRAGCVVMRTPCRIGKGARIRWKLSLAEPTSPVLPHALR